MHDLEEQRWRLRTIFIIIVGGILLVMGRLFYLQVLQHDQYRSLAAEEHWRTEVVPAHRGTILDAKGRVLAVSVTFESLYADTRAIGNPEEVARALAPILGEEESQLRSRLDTKQTAPVLLKGYLPTEVAAEVRRLKIWGLYLRPEPKRLYPQGNLAAQVIGVVGADRVGLSGIEASFDEALAGRPGSLVAERDTGGEEIALGVSYRTLPVDGADVVLTLDSFIQHLAERELDMAIAQHQASGGSVVVLDPQTGEILAMASRPTFDADDPDLFRTENLPLFNLPAVSAAYEPGSIFKVVTMAAALDAGAVTPETAFMNQGKFDYEGGTVRNALWREPGMETMLQTLQRSSNIGAAFAATRLGAEKFYRTVLAFGFGEPTGVGLPGESAGIVKLPGGQGWHPFDLATNAFGQGISVTPLQMAAAVAAVANGGILMKPYLVKEIVSPAGRKAYHPTMLRQVISPQTAKTLSDMLVSVVEYMENGQVRLSKVPGYRVAGKTGTAEIPGEAGYEAGATIASFVGYGPAENPRFVILVKIDRPQGSPWGETVAAPVFRRIAQQLMVYFKVPPSTSTEE